MSLSDVTVSFNIHELLGGDFDTRRTKAYVTTNVESGTLADASTGETRLGNQTVAIGSDGTGTFTTWAPGADGNPVSWQTTFHVDYPRAGTRDRTTRAFGPYTITGTSKTVTNKELVSNVATLTTSEAHGLVVGNTITVAAVDSTFNGTFTITAVGSSTTLSYAKTHADVASVAATGTLTSPNVRLTSLEDEQAIPAEYQSTFIAEAEAAAAAAAEAAIADELAAALAAQEAAEAAQAAAEAAEAGAVDISGISTSDGVVSALIAGTAGAGTLTRAQLDARLGIEHPVPTGGAGTSGSLWTHSDGTGGIATALAASRTAKMLYVKRGYYAVTTAATAILSDDKIHFEPGVVLVVSGFTTNQNVFQCIGTSGTYKSGFTITGAVIFDLTAQGATQVRGFDFEYCEDFTVDATIRSKSGSGNVVRLVNVRGQWYLRRVARKTTETAGSCVFTSGTTDGHIHSVYADGGDEALDLSNSVGLIADFITGVNCSEPLDVGDSRACQIGKVYGRNNIQGVNFKHDTGVALSTGCVGNYIGSIHMEDMQANVAAVTFTNDVEAAPNEDNRVGSIYSRSTASNTCAVKFVGISAASPIKRGRVDHVSHVGPSEAVIYSKCTVGCHVGDENSYYETTGNSSAIFLSDSGSDTFNHYRPTVRGKVYAPNRTGSGNGAVSLFKVDGQGEVVFDGHIIGSGAEGIVTYKSKSMKLGGVVEETANSGLKIRVVDDANYRGRVNIRWHGRMKNTAKSAVSGDCGVRVVEESGTPTIQGIHVDQGSSFLDDQSSSTGYAINFGIADPNFCSAFAHIDTSLLGVLAGGSLPTRRGFSGRRTGGSSDDLLAEMAALNSGSVYVRSLASADATLVSNTHTPCNANAGSITMTLPTPTADDQIIRVERTNEAAVTLTVTGSPTGGDYVIRGAYLRTSDWTVVTADTAAIAYNASSATVQTALRALGGPFAVCTVAGSAGGPYTVIFAGAAAAAPGVVPTLALQTNGLTGGSSPSITVAATNKVTVTGNIRGTGATSIVLTMLGDTLTLQSKLSGTTWRPVSRGVI